MPHPAPNEPDADLVAYLDGELDPRASRAMEKRLRADSRLRARAEAIRKTWNLLDYLPQPEPSPSFTSRTLVKVAVLRPASLPMATAAPAPDVVEPSVRPRRPNPWPRRALWAAAAAAVFLVAFTASGSLGRKAVPEPVAVTDDQIAQDLRVVENLNLYQYGDDLAFLMGLDQPDLFGDDSAGR
jgi:anti-sigma factor RsiW